MASTSGTLWNESVIVPNRWSGGQLVTPEVKSTATYQCERNGSQLRIKIDTSNHCTSRGAYWDWRWAFSVSVNGVDIASNIQIKPRTYLNTIGTRVYSASTGWATVNIGSANSVVVSVRYYDTQAYNNSIERRSMGGGSLTLGNIPQLPSVSISQNSKTHNSIRVNYSTGGSYDYVRIFLNNNKYGDFTGSPITISNLSPNTTYKIFAKAHGNGGFGGQSNTLTIKTYLTPSTVSSNKIENLEPFSCSAYITSSNANNTSKYEFALCDINKNVVQGAYQTNNSYYNFTGMQEETSYYIRYRVQSKDSGSWSNYVYSPLFKTPADQVRAWGKINGSWNKGKVFLKKDGQWVKAKKAYVKINGEWILSINKYD